VRFYFVLFLANEKDIWFYMADSLNWCSIEIYAGTQSPLHDTQPCEADFASIAIICSSASTFKALLRTYLPKIWGSAGSRGGPSGEPRHEYDQSHSGQFVMKPFGASSNKSHSNRKYGVSDLTEIGNDSEEAIVNSQNESVTKVDLPEAVQVR
jgi:hypothetical protein